MASSYVIDSQVSDVHPSQLKDICSEGVLVDILNSYTSKSMDTHQDLG